MKPNTKKMFYELKYSSYNTLDQDGFINTKKYSSQTRLK